MEKLILHLSPVTRRKSLRTSAGAQAGSAPANRRTLSEPNKNRMMLLNGGGTSKGAAAAQAQRNNRLKKASLSNDLKAVAVVAVHEVQMGARAVTGGCSRKGTDLRLMN